MWSRDGQEIFYVKGAQGTQSAGQPSFMCVSRHTRRFILGNPVVHSRKPSASWGAELTSPIDIGPDHVIIGVVDSGPTPSPAPAAQRIEIVLNWSEELKARVPTK